MDAANPRQILYSDAAFREHVGTESASFTTDTNGDQYAVRFHGPIEVFAKHGLQILVYRARLDEPTPFLSDEEPASRHQMLVSLTPLPKEVVGTFSERIREASQIAFIQLTGDRFLLSFNAGKIEFSKTLERFWVFMPSPETYLGFQLTAPQATPDSVAACVKKWDEFFSKLREQFPNADFKLGLFKEPPYIGASFIDWDYPHGKVHVSPYIWDVAAPDCPGFDVQWIGNTPSEIYKRYVTGLRYLDKATTNALTSGRRAGT
jgi:hypothetical protein